MVTIDIVNTTCNIHTNSVDFIHEPINVQYVFNALQ